MSNCRRRPNVKRTLGGRMAPAAHMSETIRLPTGPESAIKDDSYSNRKRRIRFMDDEVVDATELSSDSGSVTSPPSRSTSSSDHADLPLRFRRYEGKFENRRGRSLFYFALFPPEKMPMRGVVLYVHGSSSHCRRHIELYKELCKAGFGVISYDLVNHGASDLDEHKTRAHISDFRHLVDDTTPSSPMPSAPSTPTLFDTGGNTTETLDTRTHKFHAAVWAAPTIGVTWNPLLYAESLLPLARLIPKARIVPAVSHDLFCQDPAFLEAFKNDPLTCTAKMTVRSGTEALNAIKRLQRDTRVTQSDSAFCAVPMLFIAGSNDGVSDQRAAIQFFASIGNSDKEFKLIEGGFHFVFEDTQKETAIEHLLQWLRARFPFETCDR
ncbi:hypothetical protein PR001_g11058 [Phytophthora rubi]|uniref:Serine aminopeptidase S33 domain-containing protein n=2 Tax=Phytophthora rubi TaxID=129364 RepID=A0A6A3KFU3_9STRA|nr:hypothetical protein PR002_g16522 [Phytophthora rubi]KAE9031238.1 hypothetical protein PR001_g11058 [Phytophthora rubi]